MRITVWNEGRHEQKNEKVKAVYPTGIHSVIADGLREHGFTEVRTATLDEPEHGLTADVLAATDVLLWWGHMAHGDVKDEIVERVYQRVMDGMGLIVLHSGHHSKIFKKLMGVNADLKWREANEKERLWVVNPAHPIADGLPDYFELPHEEMYGEPFGIPEPDSLVLVSWFQGGEIFRSGCCFYRGRGKVFYFRPGHETFPTYYDKNVRHVIANGVRWAAPTNGPRVWVENRTVPLEPLPDAE
ncbi:MAG: ThuA domain-containing protein [Anaerolineae bacterium]|uniref:ThuA domain-containing protein n=1 Tax=Candidatus Flexifilum breve TaxID=3140694 RepID=UPI001AC4ED35|nr:ThuA domain-containing protein [Chloroflexota bacterium]MBK9751653.1 ThuA domain-containing protein [Chloroflexota bacterium]MBN8636602.1 ThuA domain-containing protein [Anaerolineae bacterium]